MLLLALLGYDVGHVRQWLDRDQAANGRHLGHEDQVLLPVLDTVIVYAHFNAILEVILAQVPELLQPGGEKRVCQGALLGR